MRKAFLGSIILLVFSISILLIQVSCNKVAKAQNSSFVLAPATTSKLGGVIVGGGLSITGDGVLSTSGNSINKILYVIKKSTSDNFIFKYEMWMANYDGSNKTKVNINLPPGISVRDNMNPKLAPDGKKIFFLAYDNDAMNTVSSLWSCNIDGSNVKQIIRETGSNVIFGGAY